MWISIDPGLNLTGLSVVDQSDGFRVVESHLVNNARSFTKDERVVEVTYGSRTVKIQAIVGKIKEIMERYKVCTIIIEAPFYNALRPAAYGALLEVILSIKYLIVIPSGIKFYAIEPRTVKRFFTASGSAGKDLMREFLKTKVVSGEIVSEINIDTLSEHEVDAVAVGYSHHLTLLNEQRGES